MAVSFKVPASPKRNVFNIDEFLGVDLTNTGANIDEVRSPNAENMVRYVPGKVRKRTGYKTKIEFSNRKDVNRAKDTSDEYVKIEGIGSDFANRAVIAEFYQDVTNLKYYLEINCQGTYVIGKKIVGGSGVDLPPVTDVEDGNAWSFADTSGNSYEEIYVYHTSSDDDDYFYVRKVRACIDSDATTSDEWQAIEWTPAPEDDGGIFIKRSSNDAVYGCHVLRTSTTKKYIYHVGKSFYAKDLDSDIVTEVYTNANKHLSKSWQLNEKLFIIDGKNIYFYQEGGTVQTIDSVTGYIPLVTIAKTPDGGGISYEPLNMLQPGFIEQFCVTSAYASKTDFHLSFKNLDNTTPLVWVLNSSGNWVQKTVNTHFTWNRSTGIIHFLQAPGVSPLTGEDNVKIQAYRTVSGYANRIKKCTIGCLFGVGGAADRLFLSGNPSYPNWDFYSEQYDPTYFPDTGYSSLGSAASKIVGYAIVNNYLATFKDDFDNSQAVFIREGDLVVNQQSVGDRTVDISEPAFKLINTLQGNGVIAPYAFGYLQTEPVFLTKAGVFAITAQDITGEKYSQNRSFYLDGKLTKESKLENAVATVYNDMYVLAVNNQFYILDGLQATRTDKSEPYSSRQYVGYYCTNIPAVSIWTDEQALWIGTKAGRVCRFGTEIDDLESYNDDGEPIYCCWETPDLDGRLFYKNKTFRYFAVRLMRAIKTSVRISSQKLGNWTFIKEDRQSGGAFDFEAIDFELFSFSTDRSEKVIHTKVRVKKVDKARFKVENGYIENGVKHGYKNEPFGLFDLALEYIESGNYKG